MKFFAAFFALFVFLTNSASAMFEKFWSEISIEPKFSDPMVAVMQMAEKKLKEADASVARPWQTARRCGCGGRVPFYGGCGFLMVDDIFSAKGLVEFWGNEENFKLAVGTTNIELVELMISRANGLIGYTEIPCEILETKDGWLLQALVTMGAGYEWGFSDFWELSDIGLPEIEYDYRLKFREHGKIVCVDISLKNAHARVLAKDAHKLGAPVSDYVYRELKNIISRYYPRELSD